MRRSALLLAALIAPVLHATPAYAATNTICVNTSHPDCVGPPLATLTEALTAANADGEDSLVLLGEGTYTEAPRSLVGTAGNALTVRGAGAGTVVTAAAPTPSAYLFVEDATVADLTIKMKGGAGSSGNTGLALAGDATADGVVVDGLGDPGDPSSATFNSIGVQVGDPGNVLTDSQILMPVSDINSQGIRGDGHVVVTDTVITGGFGSRLTTPGAPSTLSRVTIRASYAAVQLESQSVAIDNAVIDLGTSNGTGLLAANFNDSDLPKTITADHLTIVGGGPGSRGVWAYASAPGAAQTTTVNLTNSIVRGPDTSLDAIASNVGQASPSTATINVSYTDFETTESLSGVNGTATITVGAAGNLVDVDPDFVNAEAGDYRLRPGSPVVDQGDPAPGGPTLDLAGGARVVDGDAVPGAVRDLGALELGDVTAPETTITTGPAGVTKDDTPTFAFTSDPGATFECRVDAGAFTACDAPFTTAPLANGPHTFVVRATDPATNVETTPATRSFSVDTVAPGTSFTKKPAKKVVSKKVRFAFSSTETASRFECKLDAKAYRPCTSPTRFKVKVGKHVLLVRATDAAGNVDATPARYRFKRVPKP